MKFCKKLLLKKFSFIIYVLDYKEMKKKLNFWEFLYKLIINSKCYGNKNINKSTLEQIRSFISISNTI